MSRFKNKDGLPMNYLTTENAHTILDCMTFVLKAVHEQKIFEVPNENMTKEKIEECIKKLTR